MDATMWPMLAGGLVLLTVGAEALVKGASRLAAFFRISPLVIGLTVVAYGTSSPELAVSLKCAYTGDTDLAVGNVIGSNIFNILFILGACAAILPLAVSRQLIRIDTPLMIGVSVLVFVLALDGRLGRGDGALLSGLLVAYTGFSMVKGRREHEASGAGPYARVWQGQLGRAGWVSVHVVLVLAGLGMLVLGARWLVVGSVTLARALGVSQLVIGLTVVAAGTSMPEVATSLVASLRGHRDIAVGNIIGSNIFNIVSVLGLSALVSPRGLAVSDAALQVDMPVMVAIALACLPLFVTGRVLDRREGLALLAYYVIYTTYLILAAGHSGALPVFRTCVLYGALPLTGVAVVASLLRTARAPRLDGGA